LGVGWFHPVVVEDDAIWLIGSTVRSATLTRLDPETLRRLDATELPLDAVRAVLDRKRQRMYRVADQRSQQWR
jgi:hypothetical protein